MKARIEDGGWQGSRESPGRALDFCRAGSDRIQSGVRERISHTCFGRQEDPSPMAGASKKGLISFVMRSMKIFYPLLVGLVVGFSPVAFAQRVWHDRSGADEGRWNNYPA